MVFKVFEIIIIIEFIIFCINQNQWTAIFGFSYCLAIGLLKNAGTNDNKQVTATFIRILHWLFNLNRLLIFLKWIELCSYFFELFFHFINLLHHCPFQTSCNRIQIFLVILEGIFHFFAKKCYFRFDWAVAW